jgi:hypothetical protein
MAIGSSFIYAKPIIDKSIGKSSSFRIRRNELAGPEELIT